MTPTFKRTLDWLKKKSNIDSSWIKKSKFVELNNIDVSEDPVRPELDLKWRNSGSYMFSIYKRCTSHCTRVRFDEQS
jgi:hypothetical protein